MNPGATITMTDLSQQQHVSVELGDDLTPAHTVRHAIEVYLDKMVIPDREQRWAAYSAGVRLDEKVPLEEVPAERTRWTVIPEISAGSR